MILNMDKIQFESRAEIGTIIKALEDWQEDHGKKDETVQEVNALQAREVNFPTLRLPLRGSLPPFGRMNCYYYNRERFATV